MVIDYKKLSYVAMYLTLSPVAVKVRQVLIIQYTCGTVIEVHGCNLDDPMRHG